ncbi:uncharacterized protein LOC125649970 [Ostrea edulis]|uniref:uncharacterized protein LOC125649970 n=1 Tax=Ostrea edulis TaxID=37623 RepID=UPI0024AF314A|nr:uncharacterized protein LOC125649970 [Ostrea edulis]
MKFLLLLVVVAYSKAFLFDDLFGSNGCTSNDDCRSRCCMTDIFGDRSCGQKYLHYLQECRLDGQERHTCGCGNGLYCEAYANIHGAAVETQHMGASGYGLCEHKTDPSTPGV